MQDMIEEYRGDLWEWGITVSGYAVEPGEYAADMRLLPGPHVLWRGVVIVKEPVTGRTS